MEVYLSLVTRGSLGKQNGMSSHWSSLGADASEERPKWWRNADQKEMRTLGPSVSSSSHQQQQYPRLEPEWMKQSAMAELPIDLQQKLARFRTGQYALDTDTEIVESSARLSYNKAGGSGSRNNYPSKSEENAESAFRKPTANGDASKSPSLSGYGSGPIPRSENMSRQARAQSAASRVQFSSPSRLKRSPNPAVDIPSSSQSKMVKSTPKPEVLKETRFAGDRVKAHESEFLSKRMLRDFDAQDYKKNKLLLRAVDPKDPNSFRNRQRPHKSMMMSPPMTALQRRFQAFKESELAEREKALAAGNRIGVRNSPRSLYTASDFPGDEGPLRKSKKPNPRYEEMNQQAQACLRPFPERLHGSGTPLPPTPTPSEFHQASRKISLSEKFSGNSSSNFLGTRPVSQNDLVEVGGQSFQLIKRYPALQLEERIQKSKQAVNGVHQQESEQNNGQPQVQHVPGVSSLSGVPPSPSRTAAADSNYRVSAGPGVPPGPGVGADDNGYGPQKSNLLTSLLADLLGLILRWFLAFWNNLHLSDPFQLSPFSPRYQSTVIPPICPSQPPSINDHQSQHAPWINQQHPSMEPSATTIQDASPTMIQSPNRHLGLHATPDAMLKKTLSFDQQGEDSVRSLRSENSSHHRRPTSSNQYLQHESYFDPTQQRVQPPQLDYPTSDDYMKHVFRNRGRGPFFSDPMQYAMP
ncbi:unnamed protein product [Notodromas monacha]|uniref:Uncharacterized protein n=1 Tax=Notodromas monacha TaxID=399045 RepID=A0A7R9GFP4_9CRUS|nr:unnamed protein product [Notodromas monacha]CAG0919371.1 unnamed protein product [Notodromas monacha]